VEEGWDEMGLRGRKKGVRDRKEKVECKLPFNKHNKRFPCQMETGPNWQYWALSLVCACVCVVGVCNSAVGSG